jgi:hypothetical protein
MREHAEQAEKRRQAAEAAERARREREARLERERLAREKWQREHPEAFRQQRERQRQRERERQRQRALERQRREAGRAQEASVRRLRDVWSKDRWFEAGLGPSGLVADEGDSVYTGGGLGLSVAVFWRRRYDGSALIGEKGSLAVAAVPVIGPIIGFFAVPRSAFLGNELGLALNTQLAWTNADHGRFRTLLLFEPRLRVNPAGPRYQSRWRINSLSGVLIPKVGLEIASDGSLRWALECMSFALAFALHQHLAAELEVALLVREGPTDQRPSLGGNLRLKLLVF